MAVPSAAVETCLLLGVLCLLADLFSSSQVSLQFNGTDSSAAAVICYNNTALVAMGTYNEFQSSDSYFNYSICCGVFAFTLPPSSPIIWKESKRDFRCPSTNTFVGGFNVTARRPPKRNNYYIWTYFCQRLPETHIFEDCMVEEERIWLEGTSTRVAVSPGRIIYRILRSKREIWTVLSCLPVRTSCYQPCIENGLINGSKCVEDLLHHQNAFILFTCVEDHMLDGPSNATCGDDEVSGGWGDIPSCTHVATSPMLVSRHSHYSVHVVGSYSTISCIVEGYPQPVMYWSLNSPRSKITTNTSARVHSLANGLLVFNPFSDSDKGIYLCHAKNTVRHREWQFAVLSRQNLSTQN